MKSNNFTNTPLPTLAALAQKETTRPVTLRVKEKTMLEFEKYAKQYNTTASYLINNLLDQYIASLREENALSPEDEKDASRQVMKQYMEKLAAKIGRIDNESLCYSIFNTINSSNDFYVDGDYEQKDSSWFAKDIEENKVGDMFIHITDQLDVELVPVDNKENSHVEKIDDGDESHWFHFYIPNNKFPIVANMLMGYANKRRALFDGNAIWDLFTLQNIAAYINTTSDTVKLAKEIGRILADYEEPLE